MRPNRDIWLLHPLMASKLVELRELLSARELSFKLHEAYRGRARQERGKARGKSKASFGSSMHNWGLAVDMVGDIEGVNPWANDHDWKAYGAAVVDVGLTWAGNWKSFVELVHCDALELVCDAYNIPANYGQFTRLARKGLLCEYRPAFGDPVAWGNWLVSFVGKMHADGETKLVNIYRQKAMQLLGYYKGSIDGVFGPISKAALSEHGADPLADSGLYEKA